jgi:hypothetical protein
MADEQGAKSFWQTIPGFMTGLATVLTAITGLVIALNQIGYFQKSSPDRPASGATAAQALSGAKVAVSGATPIAVARPPMERRPTLGRVPEDALSGIWLNNSISAKNGRPEGRLVITRLPQGTLIIQGWGNCEPKECNWGAGPLQIVTGNSRRDFNGLHATAKLIHVAPAKNREDVNYLTLNGTGLPNSLAVRRRYEAYIDGQLHTQIERIAVYSRAPRTD